MSEPTPAELVERAIAAAGDRRVVAIVGSSDTTNLRWANNSLTTNGHATSDELTVVGIVDSADGARMASVSRTHVEVGDVPALVDEAMAAAADAAVADDAADLVEGVATDDFGDDPAVASLSVLADVASWLGEIFTQAKDNDEGRYGYAEHSLATTYLGTSSGVRRRFVQPEVRLELTGRSTDGSRSAWSGQAGADFAAIDLAGIEADVAKRLEWSRRRQDLPAGRYDTILPPSAVGDLMVDFYWGAGALDAFEGQSVFSRAGGGTRVGDRLTSTPLTLRSDPAMPGQQTTPFVVAGASSRMSSVFDNGAPVSPTDWLRGGELTSLIQTRHSARRTDLAFTPFCDNLELTGQDATQSLDEIVAGTERGLLLTCLWYIREVDPQTMLLTGLTRDGVFLVEGGEVTGAVNNFRFNESPVLMLDRVSAVGRTEDTLPREMGDYFTRTRMPTLVVSDFLMSSVSQAS